jgi:hypothetical protein
VDKKVSLNFRLSQEQHAKVKALHSEYCAETGIDFSLNQFLLLRVLSPELFKRNSGETV